MSAITITSSAEQHFNELLKSEADNVHLRLFVSNPSTADANVGIELCLEEEADPIDLIIKQEKFNFFVDGRALEALKDAVVDFETSGTGGEIVIRAPSIKGSAPGASATLTERVQYLLDTEIAPYLASHGGKVALVGVSHKKEVLLKLGGGCQGCGMASVTLKQHVSKLLQEKIQEITAIKDVTEHDKGENPYI